MLSLEQLKRIDPDLENLPEGDLERVRAKLYELGQFAFEQWSKERIKPKAVPIHPLGLSLSISGSCKI